MVEGYPWNRLGRLYGKASPATQTSHDRVWRLWYYVPLFLTGLVDLHRRLKALEKKA